MRVLPHTRPARGGDAAGRYSCPRWGCWVCVCPVEIHKRAGVLSHRTAMNNNNSNKCSEGCGRVRRHGPFAPGNDWT